MAGRVLGPPLHVRADRGRRRVEDRHAVALDERPPARLVREVGRPLVEHRRGAVAERPVDDVAVPGDPADVGGAPEDVGLGLQVEHVVVCGRDADEVAACRMRDPLRLRGRARRVHQEEQILRVHRLAGTRRRVVGDVEVVQPAVAPVLHRNVVARPPYDEAGAEPGRRRHRLVRRALERHGRAAAPGLVLRDQHLAAHVVRAAGERIGREPAEDDRVRRPEARAGEHRDRQLGHHSHVDRDLRPLDDAELLQDVRHPDDASLQVGIRQRLALVLGLALPQVGDTVAEPCLDVAVDAVVRDVERAAEEPLRVRQLPFRDRRELLEPRHALARLAGPELLRVGVVELCGRVRLGCEVGIGREPALLVEERLDRPLAHRASAEAATAGSSSYG